MPLKYRLLMQILYANEANGWKERLRDRVLSIDEIKKLSDLHKTKMDFIITPHDASILRTLIK